MSDKVHVFNESDPVVSVGVNNLEDFGEKVVFRSESEEECVVSNDVNEVLETESKSAGIFFVLSLDDDFDKKDLKDDGDEFLECGEFVLSGLKLEVSVNNVCNFILIELENAL